MSESPIHLLQSLFSSLLSAHNWPGLCLTSYHWPSLCFILCALSLSALVPIRAFIHVDFSLSLSLSLSPTLSETRNRSGVNAKVVGAVTPVISRLRRTCAKKSTAPMAERARMVWHVLYVKIIKEHVQRFYLFCIHTLTQTNTHTHTHTHTRARLHTQIRARTHSGRCACPKEWSGYRCRLSTAYNSTRNEVCSPSPGNITSYDCWYDCSSRPRQENYECIVLKKTGPTSFTRGGSKSGWITWMNRYLDATAHLCKISVFFPHRESSWIVFCGVFFRWKIFDYSEFM